MSEYIFKTNLPIRACRECPMAMWDGFGIECHLREDAEYKHGTCPLIEVPPHGVLTDIDVLNDAIIEAVRLGEITGGEAGFFKAILTNAPIVIDTSKH